MPEYKLFDVVDQTINGLFSVYYTAYTPAWLTQAEAALLDDEYINNYSGEKLTSIRIDRTLSDSSHTVKKLNATDLAKLASICNLKFAEKWKRYAEAIEADYNPLHNYSMTETETPAETTVTETPAETTETITPAETTVTETPAETTVETTNANNIFGFNSTGTDGSPESKSTAQSSGTVDESGTTKTEVDTAGSNKIEVDAAGTRVLTVQNDRELTREGNIGVTTSTQMLQEHLDFWHRFTFVDMLFNDVDSILTIPIY